MKELLETGVQLGLTYHEEEDALIGNIKGYSAAVRENLAAGSYGILMWIKRGEYAAVKSADDYLEDQKRLYPDLIKNYRVTELGTAIALNRASDDFTNVTNLKRFLYDLADHLSLNFYENCCCECGGTEELSIREVDGVIAQVCAKCGERHRSSSAKSDQSPQKAQDAPQLDPSQKDKQIKIQDPAPREESALMDEAILSPLPDAPDEPPKALEDEGFSSLLFSDREEEKPEPPRSALFEEAEREFREEQARAAAEAAETAGEPEDDGFDDLMFDEIYEEPPEIVPEEPKRDPVPEIGFSELLINDDGEVELKKETPEEDDGTVVTEIRDDSNDGAPIDVTAIESLVLNPTVTTGHPRLDAEETPLGRDGSVPLVNPNANREEKQVSSPDGPDAVTPLSAEKNAYAASASAAPEEKKDGAYAVGYASADMMIDRDAPDRSYRGAEKRPAPTPYSEGREYGGEAPPPYDPASVASSYAHHRAYRASSNAFMGIIGALTCGVVGVAIWVLIAYYLNVIGSLGAVAIIFTTFGGYYLAGRSMDKKGIVISAILSLGMTFVGVAAMTVVDVHSAISEAFGKSISLFDTLGWIGYFIRSDASIRGDFLENLGFSFLVTGISVVVSCIYLWRQAD
ncbi:MAG: hypothetical protein NC084_12760 [Bacteroides sp.]|nr:hypothetical protein [Eubacterium sp.]MCM1419610.1 hypothetical protein [Roseburia sp.]MCM1463565.1 hypothetical protein [Bacteroides sp.]